MNTEPVKAIAQLDDGLSHTRSVRARTKAFFGSRNALTKPIEVKKGWLKRFQERNAAARKTRLNSLNDVERYSEFVYVINRLFGFSVQSSNITANKCGGGDIFAAAFCTIALPIVLPLRLTVLPFLFCGRTLGKTIFKLWYGQ